MNINPKLSSSLAITARKTAIHANPRDQVLMLYRHVQKQVPFLLSAFGIDEPVENVRSNIKQLFMRHGKEPLDPRMTSMLIFKGQNELDEALAQWKTRTHIQKYVYDISSKPHLGRSAMPDTPANSELLGQPEALKKFLAQDAKGW